jgi:hypothetical protein
MNAPIPPTVFRAPTLAEAKARAQETIFANQARGVYFTRLEKRRVDDGVELTIHWSRDE